MARTDVLVHREFVEEFSRQGFMIDRPVHCIKGLGPEARLVAARLDADVGVLCLTFQTADDGGLLSPVYEFITPTAPTA
jgi:hypothetical protein